MKSLYRSRTNKRLGGVLGGIAHYLQIDPTVVRLIFIVLLFLTSVVPLSLAYGAAYMLMPEEKDGEPDGF